MCLGLVFGLGVVVMGVDVMGVGVMGVDVMVGRRNGSRRSGKVPLMVRDAMFVCLYAYCRAYFMSKTVLAYIVYKLLLSTLCC